jgi:hypothetical protein
MKMKTKFLMVFMVLVSFLFFTSCGGDSGNVETNFKPYVGGDKGVTMAFIPGMPSDVPGAILDNGEAPFAIGLMLKNEGEFNINAESDNGFLQVELIGIQPNYFNIVANDLTQTLDEDLPGARLNVDGTIQQGEFVDIEFPEMSYIENTFGDLPIPFQVNLCYDYGTKSSTRICVADDVNKALVDTNYRSICEINSARTTINSGAPLQVMNLRQSPLGGSKISVVFDVKRVGLGNVFLYNSNNGCDSSSKNTDKDKVIVEVSLPDVSDATLECTGFESTGEGKKVRRTYKISKETGGVGTFNCKVIGNEDSDRISLEVLTIDLYYRYNEQLQKEILVKDSGSDE